MDDSFGARGQTFVIFAQAAVLSQPGEGPFNDPAAGEHHETATVVGAQHRLEAKAETAADPAYELPAVAAVDPDEPDLWRLCVCTSPNFC